MVRLSIGAPHFYQFSTIQSPSSPNETELSSARVWPIAAPVASDRAPGAAALKLVPPTLAAFARELNDLAQRDLRFERAAMLAKELEDELTLLPVVIPPRTSGRRSPPRRPRA